MSVRDYNTREPQLVIRPMSGFDPAGARELRDRLLSFEYESTTKPIDVARLELDNTDGKLLSRESIVLGIGLEVQWGYVGSLCAPRLVTCKKIKGLAGERRSAGGMRPTRESLGGSGKVFLECEARSHQMNRMLAADGSAPERQSGRMFFNMTITDIVREIARVYGFEDDKILIEEPPHNPVRDFISIPADETDAQFVVRQANHFGFLFSADDFAFRFHSRDFATGTTQFTYFMGDPDVMNYEIDGDLTLGAPRRVSARGVNPRTGQIVTFTTDPLDEGPMNAPEAANETREREVGVPSQTLGGMGQYVFGGVRSELDVLTVSNASERAIDAAVRRQKAHADRKWKLKLELVGNPTVFSKQKVSLDGFGYLINGAWFLRKVTHKYTASNVYTTTIDEATRKSPGAGNEVIHNPNAESADIPGQVGQGQMVGTVRLEDQ